MKFFLGLAVVGIIAWLSGEENNAREEYYAKGEQLERETQERQQQLRNLRRDTTLAKDYYKNLKLHRASVATANACFAHYDEHKKLVKMMRQRAKMFYQQIVQLKKERDALPYHQQTAVRAKLKQMRAYLEEANAECMRLMEHKSVLLEQLRGINQQTREIKQYIAENCGSKGLAWAKGLG